MKTLTQNRKPVTDGQKKLIIRMIGDVADSDPVQEAINALSTKGAEQVKGNPEFVESLQQFAVRRIGELGTVNDFANEEVACKYGYFSGYKPGVQDLDRQIGALQAQFPGLGGANTNLLGKIKSGEITLPKGAEKFFAVVNRKKHPQIFGATYSQAVQTVLDVLEMTRNGAFQNYRKGKIDEAHLCQSARSEQFWDELAKEQGDADILIIAAQFGKRHGGRSVRRARIVIEDTSGETGLGAFVVGCMLLTHPERLQNLNDLWVDLPGDEFAPGADGVFSWSPVFYWDDGRLGFASSDVDFAFGVYFGSASGFPPQYPCTSKT